MYFVTLSSVIAVNPWLPVGNCQKPMGASRNFKWYEMLCIQGIQVQINSDECGFGIVIELLVVGYQVLAQASGLSVSLPAIIPLGGSFFCSF